MKKKFILSIEESLIDKAKHYAQASDTTVSQMIEALLSKIELTETESFCEKWAGVCKKPPKMNRNARTDYLLRHHMGEAF